MFKFISLLTFATLCLSQNADAQILQENFRVTQDSYNLNQNQLPADFWESEQGLIATQNSIQGLSTDWEQTLRSYNNNRAPQDQAEADFLDFRAQQLNDPFSTDFSPYTSVPLPNSGSLMIGSDFSPNTVMLRTPDILEGGAVFNDQFVFNSVSQQTINTWLSDPNASIDLEALGLAEPDVALNAYVLADVNGALTNVIVSPVGKQLTAQQKQAIADAQYVRRPLPRWGERLYATVEAAMSQAVNTVCTSSFLPREFTIKMNGEGSVVVATGGIEISATFNSSDVCPTFIVHSDG